MRGPALEADAIKVQSQAGSAFERAGGQAGHAHVSVPPPVHLRTRTPPSRVGSRRTIPIATGRPRRPKGSDLAPHRLSRRHRARARNSAAATGMQDRRALGSGLGLSPDLLHPTPPPSFPVRRGHVSPTCFAARLAKDLTSLGIRVGAKESNRRLRKLAMEVLVYDDAVLAASNIRSADQQLEHTFRFIPDPETALFRPATPTSASRHPAPVSVSHSPAPLYHSETERDRTWSFETTYGPGAVRALAGLAAAPWMLTF
ncbi:hypothetical protein HETIRDRAFT_107719 [Heterobasidion irregulare TC 32-1]|uniref:Uncharacterized protein n=1 Tax=Heterobasidion irregulare (strain TC 32-1) TaxID=747525 RepID=W4JX32_HETIT|nr:uncharacterized protein HETIRDRAFT_107719 [Heterobasidion irregulare TC 32-1]ETW78113.1 hypothetical protein HETIRDRAFT_107719 [Heterobasidion irregulare TC 32-1]